jgi:Protein of unknown function (DUF2384)
MKRSEAKSKKVLSGATKLPENREAKVPPGRTKLSEIQEETGKFKGLIQRNSFYSPVEVAEMLSASSPLRKKPKATNVDPNLTEYATVLAHAVDTFGSRPNANAWLHRPNRMFANQTPLQILTEDPAAVEEELVRIDHGMFV